MTWIVDSYYSAEFVDGFFIGLHIFRVFRNNPSYFRRFLNPSNIIQLKCHLAILYPTYVCIITQICLALYELVWKQWMAKVKVAISQWTQTTNIAKNWLRDCLTFLIRKWELKMTGKPLSPFWNWESQENHNRGLLAPAHSNSRTQTPCFNHWIH